MRGGDEFLTADRRQPGPQRPRFTPGPPAPSPAGRLRAGPRRDARATVTVPGGTVRDGCDGAGGRSGGAGDGLPGKFRGELDGPGPAAAARGAVRARAALVRDPVSSTGRDLADDRPSCGRRAECGRLHS
jgi:hypothetical protein